MGKDKEKITLNLCLDRMELGRFSRNFVDIGKKKKSVKSKFKTNKAQVYNGHFKENKEKDENGQRPM